MTVLQAEKGLTTGEVSLRLVNLAGREIQLVLEPWGECYSFAPHDEFVVVAEGPHPVAPEVAYEDESVTVWGWVGSTMHVFKNGEELGAGSDERPRVPDAFPKTELGQSRKEAHNFGRLSWLLFIPSRLTRLFSRIV